MNVNIKNYLPETIIPKKGKNKKLKVYAFKDRFLLTTKRCRKSIILPRIFNLDDKDLISLGLYLAEGQKYINLDHNYHHSGEIVFSNSELISLKLFLKLMKKFGISASEFRWTISLNVNFKDKVCKKELFNYWTKHLGLIPSKARLVWLFYSGTLNKPIPSTTRKYGCLNLCYSSTVFRNFFLFFINKIFDEIILTKNKTMLSLLLKGYFAGDGCASYCPKYYNRNIYFCCKDKLLISKLKKSLSILGVNSIIETSPETTKTNSRSLIICNHKDISLLNEFKILNLIFYKAQIVNKLLNEYKMPPAGFEPTTSSS